MAKKVLVVDDEKLIVKGIRFSLLQDGMEVDCDMGSFRLVAGNRHLHRYYNFAGRAVETVPRSLRLSCGSELT